MTQFCEAYYRMHQDAETPHRPPLILQNSGQGLGNKCLFLSVMALRRLLLGLHFSPAGQPDGAGLVFEDDLIFGRNLIASFAHLRGSIGAKRQESSGGGQNRNG